MTAVPEFDADGWLKDVPRIPSPNCDERPAGSTVDLIVIHSISLPPGEYGGDGILRLFTNTLDPVGHPYYATIANLRVSPHFLIRRNGELIQFVPAALRAWHAGESCWRGRTRCNDFSIGIELEGTDHAPFEDAQYSVLADLTRAIEARYPALAIAGHSDIAPGRKTDPGPCFEWERYRALLAMEIGNAGPDDYAGILALQSANYVGNLAVKERDSGFLSAELTRVELAAMAEDLGVVVAREGGRVVGYLCAHPADLDPLQPVVEAMLRCARAASHRGRPLAATRFFVYGPVCIARSHRGRGLARRLFDALRAAVAGRYEYGVTLVADANPHSLRVHVDGLGMEDAGEFEHAGRAYHLLVFPVRPGAS